MIKRNIAVIIVAAILICAVSVPVFAAVPSADGAPELNSGAAILINVNTDEVIFEKNSDVKVYPAAAVKLMTAIIVFDKAVDLDAEVAVDGEAIKRFSDSLKDGEYISIRSLLYMMLVNNANDAATVLAEHIAGNVDNFVNLMNAKAKELGAYNTVFKNPTGTHNSEMYTTAYDMAIIAKYAALNSELVAITSSLSYTIPATNISKQRTIYNKNLILSANSSYYYKNAKGMSSGNTEQAGYNLITLATEKGIPIICVVMNSIRTKSGVIYSYKDAKSLLKWAFGSYDYVTVMKASEVSYELPVKLSIQTDHVLLYPDKDIELLLPTDIDKSTDIKKEFNIKADHLDAPVKKGTAVGEVSLIYNDAVIAKAVLLTASDIERSNTLFYLDCIDRAVATTWFKVSISTFVILITIYAIITLTAKNKSKSGLRLKKRKRHH